MKTFWFLIYNLIVVPLLYISFRAASIFSRKIREGIRDRKRLFDNLESEIKNLDSTKKLVWFHSASMGEFEQAKPIIEKLKNKSEINILVTFFSPSGFRNSLKYKYKDVISYIPFDSYNSVQRFVKIINPHIAIFMRYDFWPNLVWQLNKKKVPTFIVDATMRINNKRKWPFAKSFHEMLFKNFERVLTVSEEDVANFKKFNLGEERVCAVGDTRFDRVFKKYDQAKELKLIKESIFQDKKVVVLGSSWPSDEEVILSALKTLLKEDNGLKVILVPHEPTVHRLEKIEENLNGAVTNIRFSFLKNYSGEQVIIVDSIGILVSLYYYADIAYVGGSFRQGIHNVLEAAVYGIPVMFGPKITNSQEALKLKELGSGILVNDYDEALNFLNKLLYDDSYRKNLGEISHEYVHSNVGATDKIIKELSAYL